MALSFQAVDLANAAAGCPWWTPELCAAAVEATTAGGREGVRAVLEDGGMGAPL